MSKALKRAAEVTAVIADFKRGTDIAAAWLASLIRKNPERADDGLSHPTLAIRVAIKDGKFKGELDLYDRTRPMLGMRATDFRLPIDEMCDREVSPRDVLEFLRSPTWEAVVTNRALTKDLIEMANR